ncbi:MAG TPA: GNAT family N-acetyltransferase [Puia sp.]|nr:GNAT family N-acetyltransferase [Puia sp.]
MTWNKEGFIISDDKKLLDIEYIHDYLSNKSYWSKNIPIQIVKKSIEGSICFGVYEKQNQIGFARVVSDKATFAYLGDVFIDENYRAKGLSKWLMEVIINYPDLQGMRRWMLGTLDAHTLYEKFGFKPLEEPTRFMHRHNPDVYVKKSDKL